MDNRRVDVMVDIETLGTGKDATIFQISAVAFDIKTGEIMHEFNKIADIANSGSLNVDGRTLSWWLKTNPQLLSDLIHQGEGSVGSLLMKFKWFIEGLDTDIKNVYLWGNGILFDNAMLQHQLENHPALTYTDNGNKYPIHYRNDRDVRTIVELASIKSGLTIDELKEKFKDESLIEHDAYDDVLYQIQLVVGCYNILTKG